MTVQPLRTQCTDARLEKVHKAFELLRLKEREMPGQVVSCFLYIASHENCHKQSLEEALQLSSASSSRATDILSKGRRGRKQPGLALITKVEDPDDSRRQTLQLTPDGKLLAQQFKDIIYG
jgi:DNA-binding MarR family transcriptional regulator